MRMFWVAWMKISFFAVFVSRCFSCSIKCHTKIDQIDMNNQTETFTIFI